MATSGEQQRTTTDLSAYRASGREQQRIGDLLALMPASGTSALDVGTRDGHLSRLLAERFARVVALDLEQPTIDHPRVECRQGDVTKLPFADSCFDAVLCAEVLEHIPTEALENACRELIRVTRTALVIGVPYKQDLRFGRTTCRNCGTTNPPWGHVNAFDEERLAALFAPLAVARISYVGSTRDAANPLAVALMDFAGNPYGTYEQEETCVHCHERLDAPGPRTILQRAATRLAFGLNGLQRCMTSAHAAWIHVRFDKHS
jgi:SAM-dependent methyltransferase